MVDTKSAVSMVTGETRAYVALSLAALFWAGNFIVGRVIGDRIDPLELNVLRWMICLALLLPFTARRMIEHGRVLLREWRLVALLGITGIAAFHVMVYQALRLTPAVNALLILAMAPVMIVVGGTLRDGFKPSRDQGLGLVVSLLGAGILITRGDIAQLAWGEIDLGKLWMLGAIVLWSWYSLLLRRRPADLPQDVTLSASVVVALVLMLPVLLVRGAAPMTPTPALMAAVLYIAIFASLLGFMLWSYGLGRIGPERAGQFIHLMPLFGTTLAILLLGERPAVPHLIGGACILAGIVLVSLAGTRDGT